jgi:hypothetical protein
MDNRLDPAFLRAAAERLLLGAMTSDERGDEANAAMCSTCAMVFRWLARDLPNGSFLALDQVEQEYRERN